MSSPRRSVSAADCRVSGAHAKQRLSGQFADWHRRRRVFKICDARASREGLLMSSYGFVAAASGRIRVLCVDAPWSCRCGRFDSRTVDRLQGSCRCTFDGGTTGGSSATGDHAPDIPASHRLRLPGSRTVERTGPRAPPDLRRDVRQGQGLRTDFNGMTACRCGGGWAVQVNVWQGHITARVVRALLRHDGKAGTTQPFTAGRYSGTLEVQQLSASTHAIQSIVLSRRPFYVPLRSPSIKRPGTRRSRRERSSRPTRLGSRPGRATHHDTLPQPAVFARVLW